MEAETRRKIEEMVLDILKKSNIEETTELSVRIAASERLGIDLSDPESKQLVRTVVESYLLTAAAEEKPPEESQSREAVKPKKEDSERVICQLSNRRNVVVRDFKGTALVSIREYYHKDGKQLPGPKGINLSADQWSTFKKSVPAIEEAITRMEGRMGSELNGEKNGEVSNSVVDVAPLEPVPIEIIRFDGKNYEFWAQQMELLLKQIKIEYVLTEPCPNATLGEDATAAAKASEKRWVHDDLMCRRNILSHLSDHLFNQYANRKMSAKELWEELKFVYQFEEYGTKRSQVKKYIEFQMVDEKAVVEQIQEFNSIADSIVAAGMSIEENFHVCVIISKLPLSWKDFCIKLMHEEYLPFWKLMERIRIEEETRNGVKQVGEPSNGYRFRQANKGGARVADNNNKPPGTECEEENVT
ncbi:Transcriptional coactivator p15 [Sesbania bispinosa]|nr:Transcriptional coactivator p15 [Sesbania bispinosa]